MYQDFKDLLSAFNAKKIRYLIVGGYAVSFHGQPRATKDIDIFIKADFPNAKAVYAALVSFGAPLECITEDDLSDPRQFIRFGREPVAVDILPGIDGVDLMAGRMRGLADVEDSGKRRRRQREIRTAQAELLDSSYIPYNACQAA